MANGPKWTGILAAMCIGLTAENARAQADYVPPLSGAALSQWQVQGEYYGTIAGGGGLGAWLIARGTDSYNVVFLPGGLVTLPGTNYGGFDKTGWAINTFSGTAKLTGTAFAVTTTSKYNATTITGTGESRIMTGTSPTGAAFTLNRVVRNSPVHLLKPKAEWGTAKLWFDSTTGQADLAKWARQENDVQLSRKNLYRGIHSVENHGGGFLHVEFQGCFNPTASGQGRSNSGIYLQSRFEAQVLDSFGNALAIDEYGSIYTIKAPPINVALPPLTWHTYDIYFTPRSSGTGPSTAGAAVMTVYANGVLVQDQTVVSNKTTAAPLDDKVGDGPLYLQNHNNEVVYNNIWFIPGATTTSLPYAKVLESATVGIGGKKDNMLRPLPDQKENIGLSERFDLSGRTIRKGESVLSIQPLFQFDRVKN
ncbi:MAG: DUF1080 domain-containing protein [Fibrobacteria bacterium]